MKIFLVYPQVASNYDMAEQKKNVQHGRRVNFERGCRINEQKGTNIEHSFQNNNIQKVFLSVIKPGKVCLLPFQRVLNDSCEPER